ncbi:MAG: endonuclease/exonuclease/phosphatase family protein [Wenzhouxiangellaceae bacterium]|nr:endonuclease/exonuclease/phosphatase family protein [Wenzhouxiangellaceae bacterium]
MLPVPMKTAAVAALLCACALSMPATVVADADAARKSSARGVVAVLFSEDFSAFSGAGFDQPPAAGQLDSSRWRALGFSDGNGSFDGSHIGGDFARGTSSGGVSSGGSYAFETGGANTALGAQPGGSDFTPGSFDLRLENTTGAPIDALQLSYSVWTFNDQSRANSMNLQWSVDDSTYAAVDALDFSSPADPDSPATWTETPRSATISDFTLAPGDVIFLRWTSDDVSGGGSRDELGIDDIVINVVAAPELALGLQGPANGLAGQPLVYAIEITNPSASDELSAITATDTLPSGLTYVADTSGVTPVVSGNTVEWAFDRLGPAQSIRFELSVDSDAGISDGTISTNLLNVGATLNGAPTSEAAEFDTTFRARVTINEIQQVADPATADTSLRVGEVVWTEGVVTAAPGEIAGSGTLVMQTTAGGAWSGLVVDGDFGSSGIQRGDEIRVVGEVVESSTLTRLVSAGHELLGQAALPAPAMLNTLAFPQQDPAASEQWESVLIEFSGVVVTEALDFGEWRFDDGSGAARGDDSGSITLTPAVGDQYGFLRGIGWFSFGDYKLQPRNNSDIEFEVEAFEIAEIQGPGRRSPFAPASGNDAGQVVRSSDNIVTAVGSNGFFIQTPDDRASAPTASRGLFVFTAQVPVVSIGDRVDVTGPVAEFFDFTQIAQPDSIDIIASGVALPAAVEFNALTPSPDPQAPSCVATSIGDTDFESVVEANLECFEGMRVSVANGFVTAPSQSFGSDPVAEAWISTTGRRVLRGKGAEFPGIAECPTCPVWSGAPQLLEIDPDRFGPATDPLAAGSRLSGAGVIGFSFGDYALWPTTLAIQSTPPLPRPVAETDRLMLTIGSLNALNLFDDAQGAARPIDACSGGREANDRVVLSTVDYATKLNKLAAYIVQGLNAPDVLALQEVESRAVLQDLVAEIETLAGVAYEAWLEPGNDIGNINNGYLVNTARVAVDSVELLAATECLSSDNSPLHDRPPLLLRGRFIDEGQDLAFAAFNNHMRSLGGIATSTRTRLKRQQQAQSIATAVQSLQSAEPDLPLVLVGDFNAFQFSDGYVDVVGQLQGLADPTENLVSQENAGNPDFDDSNITDPVLLNALSGLPEVERYSFIFRAVSQTLDHALVSRSAAPLVANFGYARANADYWDGFEFVLETVARASDHDGYVLAIDADRIFANDFE